MGSDFLLVEHVTLLYREVVVLYLYLRRISDLKFSSMWTGDNVSLTIAQSSSNLGGFKEYKFIPSLELYCMMHKIKRMRGFQLFIQK